jgi:hypothetical protein
MNKKAVKHTLFSGLLVLAILIIAGCGKVVVIPQQPQLLLNHSETQTLVIRNTHGVPLTVLGCKPDGPEITIPVNGEVNLKFTVIAVMDLKQPSSWRPRWFEMAGTSLIYAEPVDGPCYLRPGPDSIIMLHHQQPGKGNQIRLNFHGCELGRGWEDIEAPAGIHLVDSNQIAGIPARICPPENR